LLGMPILKAFDFDARGIKYARLAVSLFGLFTCLLGAYMTLGFFELQHPARAAAAVLLLLLFNSELASWASTFMPDGVAVGLFLASMVALRALHRAERPRPLLAVPAGVLFAVAALVKFDYVYLLGGLVGYSLLVGWVANRAPRRERLRRVATVAIAGAVYALLLVGYGVRNRAHTGSFFITSKDTVNLWIGNNSYATGSYMWSPKWTDPPDADAASKPVDETVLQTVRAQLAPQEQRVLDRYVRSMAHDDLTAFQRRLARLAPAAATQTVRDLLVTLSPELHEKAVRALLTTEELAQMETAFREMPPDRRGRAETMIAQSRPQDAVRFIRSEQFMGGAEPNSPIAEVKARLEPSEIAELELVTAGAPDQAQALLMALTPDAGVAFLRRSVLRPTPKTLASGILKVAHQDLALRDQYRRRFYYYLSSHPLGFVRGLLHKLWLFATQCGAREFGTLGGASPVISYGLELAALAALVMFLLGKWGRTRRFEIGMLFLAYFAEMGVLVLVFVDPRLLLLNVTLATLIGVAFFADVIERYWSPWRARRAGSPSAKVTSG